MSAEITHQTCRGCAACGDEGGHVVQIVSPERLREILDAAGESYDRPRDFGPRDEWEVAS